MLLSVRPHWVPASIWGNMADVVIVAGTKRGNDFVPVLEIKQMIGRAGRKHGGGECLAHVIVEDDRASEIQSGIDHGTNMEVHSSFGSIDKLFFHLMPEIASGRVSNVESAEAWFSRSLAFRQDSKKINFQKVFNGMEKEGAIHQVAGVVKPTKVGIIASDLYFHPGDVQAWRENFGRIFEMGLENDTSAIAWALGTRTHTKCHGDFADHRFVIGEYKGSIPLGLDLEQGTVTQVVLWWCCMGGPPVGRMRNQMLELRDDIGRIRRALVRLDREIAGWDKEEFFADMEIMIRRRIGTNLVELCKLPGITKGRAEFLYDKGAYDADSIAGIAEDIKDELDEPFSVALKGITDGVLGKSR